MQEVSVCATCQSRGNYELFMHPNTCIINCAITGMNSLDPLHLLGTVWRPAMIMHNAKKAGEPQTQLAQHRVPHPVGVHLLFPEGLYSNSKENAEFVNYETYDRYKLMSTLTTNSEAQTDLSLQDDAHSDHGDCKCEILSLQSRNKVCLGYIQLESLIKFLLYPQSLEYQLQQELVKTSRIDVRILC